jgi:hypothetical protein
MEYPLAEVLDRLTIETRKAAYSADNGSLLKELRDEICKSLGPDHFITKGKREFVTPLTLAYFGQKAYSQWLGEIVCRVVELALANADVANLEWQLREGRQLTLEETGLRAKKIREINDRRVAAKNALAKLFGQHSEARVFGYGEGLPAEKLTLEVQGGGGV